MILLGSLLATINMTGCATIDYSTIECSDWGPGTENLEVAYSRISDCGRYGDGWNLITAQGMLSVLTWEQACAIAKRSATNSVCRALVIKELLAPWKGGRSRFIGMNRERLYDYIGIPEIVKSNDLYYVGYSSLPNIGRYVFSCPPDDLCYYYVTCGKYDILTSIVDVFNRTSIVLTDFYVGRQYRYFYPDEWGCGVRDLKPVARQLSQLFKSDVGEDIDYARGKLMMLSFEQACELYRARSLGWQARDAAMVMLTTLTSARFMGNNEAGLKKLLGKPTIATKGRFIYSPAADRRHSGAKRATAFSFGSNGWVEKVEFGFLSSGGTKDIYKFKPSQTNYPD